MVAWIYVLLAIVVTVYTLAAINFSIKIKHFKMIGTTYVCVIFAYLVCLGFSLYVNLNPVIPPETPLSPWVTIAGSFFDALKMMVLSLDKAVLSPFFSSGPHNLVFGITYVAASALALIFTSVSVVLVTFKMFGAKIATLFKRWFTKGDIFYIFADSRSPIALRFAEKLRSDKRNIVVIFISRASQKTQEGTEYKDSFVLKSFDVRTENFTMGLSKVIFRNFGKKHRVFVYGLLSEDDDALKLASNFSEAISKNKLFNKINNEKEMSEEHIKYLEDFKVFINYNHVDFDINNNFSKNTLHMVNTLSQCDIVSTDFIMNNTIDKFVDFNKVNDKENNEGYHVSFLGFGKVNKEIFKKMIQAYQLWGDNINKVHYHIGDYESDMHAAENNNLYTQHSKNSEPPFLYSVDSFCNGLDLTQYENLNNHIKSLVKDKNRFSPSGFELFVVSASEQNNDIEIATLLRKSLLINLDEERLRKSIIFVRVTDSVTSSTFKQNNVEKKDGVSSSFVLSQEEFNTCIAKGESPLVPIVIFGEDALISSFVPSHYQILEKLGTATMKSYYGLSTVNETKNLWLRLNKSETLANMEVNYSLRAKLAVFNYIADSSYTIRKKDTNEVISLKDFKDEIAKSGFPKIDLSKPIFKLASLEHNRWLANSYLVYKYEPLSFEDFVRQNTVDNKFVPRKNNWTKDKGVRHVCMVTNKKLMELKDLIISKDPNLEAKANNLAFYTDINAIGEVFIALSEIQKRP